MCTSKATPAPASAAEIELGDNAAAMQAASQKLKPYQGKLYDEMSRDNSAQLKQQANAGFYQNRGQSRGQGLATNVGPLAQQRAGIDTAMAGKSLNAEMARLTGGAGIGSTLGSLNSTAGGVNSIADAQWRGDQAFTNQLITSGSKFYGEADDYLTELSGRQGTYNDGKPVWLQSKSQWDFFGRDDQGKSLGWGRGDIS